MASPEVDLWPVLQLASFLVAVLAAVALFARVPAAEAVLPALDAPDALAARQLDLTIRISEEGLTITGAEEVFGTSLSIPCLRPPCTEPEQHDCDRLTEVLGLVKDEFPRAEIVRLVPAPRTSYAMIVRVMDATREDVVRVDADGRPRLLFPTVVITGSAR